MVGGKITEYDTLIIGHSFSGSISVSGITAAGYVGSELIGEFTDTSTTTAIGYRFSLASKIDPFVTPVSVSTYVIDLPGLYSHSESFNDYRPSMSQHIEVIGLKEYVFNNQVYYTTFTEINYYIEGSLFHTISGTHLSNGVLTPAGLPFRGIAPVVIPNAFYNPVIGIGVVPPGSSTSDYEILVSVTASGYNGFKEVGDTSYTFLPLQLSKISASLSCDCSTGTGIVSGTTCGNATATAKRHVIYHRNGPTRYTCTECDSGPATIPGIVDVWYPEITSEDNDSSIHLQPFLAKSIGRMNSDYRDGILRGGLPQTKKVANSNCRTSLVDEGSPIVNTAIVHKSYTYANNVLGNSSHIIEEPLSEGSYAPYIETGYKWKGVSTDGIEIQHMACPPLTGTGDEIVGGTPVVCYPVVHTFCDSGVGSHFPDIETDTDNPYLFGALYHPNIYARYTNYCCHQHWSYFHFFPSDGDTNYWKVLGSKENSNDYWVPIRTQVSDHPEYPSIENYKTRNSLVSAPLAEGAHGSFIQLAFVSNSITSWWGNTRFKVQKPIPDSSKQLTSSDTDNWSYTDCTASFVSDGIVLTPSATIIKAKYNIGSWTDGPRMYTHICKSIQTDWFTPNITSVDVVLGNDYGDEYVLMSVPDTVNKSLTKQDSVYGGTWGQEFGDGIISDLGLDTLAGTTGKSFDLMTSVEKIHFFSLFLGRGAAYLTFKITVTSTSSTVKIKYPIFHLGPDDAVVIQESGHHACMIVKNSVGFRYGQWAWFDDTTHTLLNEPNYFPIGHPSFGWKSSLLDWLCYKRVVFDGVAKDLSLRTELDSLFDNYEYTGSASSPSSDNDAFERADTQTISFIVNGGKFCTGILVNTVAEIPPLAMSPKKERDSNWIENGSYVQKSYCYTQGPRYYVHPNREMHLDDSIVRWTSNVPTVDGWTITTHNHALTNLEGGFNITLDGDSFIYANATPWHGYFANLYYTPALQRVVNKKHMNRNIYTNANNELRTQKQKAPVYATKNFTQDLVDVEPDILDNLYVIVLDGTTLKLETKIENTWSGLYMSIDTNVRNGAHHIPTNSKFIVFGYYHIGASTLVIKIATLFPVTILDTFTTNITDIKDGSEIKLNSFIDIDQQVHVTVTYINTSDAFIYKSCVWYNFTSWS